MFDAFHFIRPEWLIALPFIAVFLALLSRRSKMLSGWENVCDAELLQFQLAQQPGSSPRNQSLQLLHWTIPFLFLIAIIALAGPSWEKKEQPVFQQENALVIILDLSISMNATDIKPSRLERAKLKLIDILKSKKEGQTALIAFAGDAHTVSPLTIDNKTILSLLPALDSSIMPLSGTHLNDALNTAKQLFKNAGVTQGDILLITDGIDPAQQNKLEKAVKNLRQSGYFFSIIGVGSKAGSPIPLPQKGGFVKDQSGQIVLSKFSAEALIKLSKLGNGQYHKLSLNDSDFKNIIDHNLTSDRSKIENNEHLEQWVDAGAYLTFVLIPIALLNFRKGLLSVVFIIFLAPSLFTESAYATEAVKKQQSEDFSSSWNNLWSTPDQQGQKAYNSHDYPQAAQHFENKDWKAGALYRAGQFKQALEYYSQSDDAKSLYNKANTLANMQNFQAAAEAYEQAIEKQADFDAAKKNLNYIKDLLAQQKKQDQKNSDQNQDSSDKQSENQQQDQKNSSDNASKGNQSDSNDTQKNQSDESDANGSGSEKKDEQKPESESPESKTQQDEKESDSSPSNDSQSDEPKSPEDYQRKKAEQDESDKNSEQQSQAISEKEQDDNTNKELSPAEQASDDVLSQLNQEEQQSLKQWLQRIPDNPGRLLKIKFRNNTLLKQRQADKDTQYEGDPW